MGHCRAGAREAAHGVGAQPAAGGGSSGERGAVSGIADPGARQGRHREARERRRDRGAGQH